MSTPEEFEVALVKAQAAIAGLRAAPTPPVSAATTITTSMPGEPATARTPARQPAAGADVLPSRSLSQWLKPALILLCIAVAFLQYYYIEISLQISSLPALFTRR
jgi:hypothetical protein